MMSSTNSTPQSPLRPATSYPFSRCSTPEPVEPSLDTLPPCADPANDMRHVMTVLSSSKLANRQQVDWQAQLQVWGNLLLAACDLTLEPSDVRSSLPQAMNDARRLMRHHTGHVSPYVHALLWDIAPMVEDLRSFVSKTALVFLLVSVLNSGNWSVFARRIDRSCLTD